MLHTVLLAAAWLAVPAYLAWAAWQHWRGR
jgi:hypothetical protein